VPDQMKIAVLGTGLMGAPMARRLCEAGHEVSVWNRSRDKAEPLAAHGATVCATPAEAARDAGLVLTMLTDGPAVSQVLFEHGAAEASAKRAIFLDMSSIRPAEARAPAERLGHSGHGALDAPVSGGTRGAEAGTLAIMAGGEAHAFATAKPVMDVLGRPVHVGPSGAGQLSKLANQAIVAIAIGAVAEATLLVGEGGGDLTAFRQALKGGFADSTILQQHGERMENRDFAPGGRSSVQLKDLDNVLAEAGELGLKLPLVAALRDRYARLSGPMGHGDLDHSALFLELLDRNERPA
jgi:2-hydroxy-3-oxopropionate reductase